LGLGDEARLHVEPVGALLEPLVERRLGVWFAGEALIAQMPQRLLPLLTRLLHLTGECCSCPLLAVDGGWTVRTTTHRSPVGAWETGAHPSPPSCCQLSSATWSAA